ncbi:hypothetical protein PLESTF_000528700 [Pleodorina starrii]|nr:hypothetical protein PLESTF_000528700 [Pleodorina starrii]
MERTSTDSNALASPSRAAPPPPPPPPRHRDYRTHRPHDRYDPYDEWYLSPPPPGGAGGDHGSSERATTTAAAAAAASTRVRRQMGEAGAEGGAEEEEERALVAQLGWRLADGTGSCTVCLGGFAAGEELRLLPGCGHVFHRDCIDRREPGLTFAVPRPVCLAAP